jgi:hypothetical protein
MYGGVGGEDGQPSPLSRFRPKRFRISVASKPCDDDDDACWCCACDGGGHATMPDWKPEAEQESHFLAAPIAWPEPASRV